MQGHPFLRTFVVDPLAGLMLSGRGQGRAVLAQEAVPAAVVPEATALSTAFTYQGQLKVNGVPAEGTYAFTLRRDVAQNGSQLGTGDVQNAVAVTNGMFTVTLNKSSQFGADAFTGAARWLEIQVCKPGAVQCIKTTLTPKSAAGASNECRTPLQIKQIGHFSPVSQIVW